MPRKISTILMVVSMSSFTGYCSWQMFTMWIDVDPVAVELMGVALLLGIMQHYLFTLLDILVTPEKWGRKLLYFGAVLIAGHFGSWVYTLSVHVKGKKRSIPKTEKMETRLRSGKKVG